MEQHINDRAMEFTLLVEAFLRDDTGVDAVTETALTDKLYALRAAIELANARQTAAKTPVAIPANLRESQEDARAIAAEARWMERNEQEGVPYGTY